MVEYDSQKIGYQLKIDVGYNSSLYIKVFMVGFKVAYETKQLLAKI